MNGACGSPPGGRSLGKASTFFFPGCNKTGTRLPGERARAPSTGSSSALPAAERSGIRSAQPRKRFLFLAPPPTPSQPINPSVASNTRLEDAVCRVPPPIPLCSQTVATSAGNGRSLGPSPAPACPGCRGQSRPRGGHRPVSPPVRLSGTSGDAANQCLKPPSAPDRSPQRSRTKAAVQPGACGAAPKRSPAGSLGRKRSCGSGQRAQRRLEDTSSPSHQCSAVCAGGGDSQLVSPSPLSPPAPPPAAALGGAQAQG